MKACKTKLCICIALVCMILSACYTPEQNASSKVKIGDYITFGKYEQDNDTSNGKEDIEWQVLEVKDGRALLVSKYALDCKPFNETETDVTWKTSTLREWLNNDFLNDAFTAEEKTMIPTVEILPDKNLYYDTNPDNVTYDQVFLLSVTEANKYFDSDYARQCWATNYTVANGARIVDEEMVHDYVSSTGIGWWWLRTPGEFNYASMVLFDGSIMDESYPVDYDDGIVRPALWLDLNSGGSNHETEKTSVGDCITFGKYEQDNDMSNGKEDIEWFVLEVKDGKALVISKYALDSKPFNTTLTEVTWETSSLRKWLNNDFLDTAFTAEEKAKIPSVKVPADMNPSYNTNPGKVTKDQVFLLSITEVNTYFSSDEYRECLTTKYAGANGAAVVDEELYSSLDISSGFCWWWLRSPGYNPYAVAFVSVGGFAMEDGDRINNDGYAVRPALWIDID